MHGHVLIRWWRFVTARTRVKSVPACPRIRMETTRRAVQKAFRVVKQVLNKRPIFQGSTTGKILIFEEFLSYWFLGLQFYPSAFKASLLFAKGFIFSFRSNMTNFSSFSVSYTFHFQISFSSFLCISMCVCVCFSVFSCLPTAHSASISLFQHILLGFSSESYARHTRLVLQWPMWHSLTWEECRINPNIRREFFFKYCFLEKMGCLIFQSRRINIKNMMIMWSSDC
jgi:hypothetical protein